MQPTTRCFAGLFAAEGDPGVDLGGAEGGKKAREHANEQREERYCGVGVWIGRGYAPDLGGEEVGEEIAGEEADCDSEED